MVAITIVAVRYGQVLRNTVPQMTNVVRVIVQLTSCLLRAEARARNVIRRMLLMECYAVIAHGAL